jgi:SPP1 gp7 family putative phage head morphogenesis protein
MPFDSDADPVKPEKAIDYFKSRLDLPDDVAEALDAESKAKAFWISGIADVDILTDVHDALNEALEKGTTYDDFLGEVGDKLEEAWGGDVANPGWRVETLFRTNLQKAYSAGRWKEHQEVIEEFPYAIFDTVDDARRSEICEAIDDELKGQALPADDPFWSTHTPPCHFSCRSQIIPLTEEQAEEVGIAKRAPKVDAAEGFGAAPDEDDWRPDPDDYPTDFQGAVKDILDESEQELSRPVALYNENHGPDGRFTSGPGGSGGKAPKGGAGKVRSAEPPSRTRSAKPSITKAPRPAPGSRTPAKKASAPPKEHTENHWVKQYGHYGQAARAVAHGRAMVERGLSMHPAEAVKQLAVFKDHPALASVAKSLEKAQAKHPDVKTVRELAEKYPDKRHIIESGAAVASHVGEMKGRTHRMLDVDHDLSTATNKDEAKGQLARGRAFMRSMVAESLTTGTPGLTFGASRSGFIPLGNRIEISNSPHAIEHEMMHALGAHNQRFLRRELAFIDARTKGEELRPLKELQPHKAYGDGERAKTDKFFDAYVGSHYEWPGQRTKDKRFASEATSMGVQAIVANPHRFYRQDPEHFMFALGQMADRGTLR